MTKQITITMNDYVFNAAFGNFQGNRSQRVEELLLLGMDCELGDVELNKSKLLTQAREINNLRQENNTLKMHNASLKQKLSGQHQLTDIEKMGRAIINRGLMG